MGIARSMTSYQQAADLDWLLNDGRWPAVAAGVCLHSKCSAVVLNYSSDLSVSLSQMT